MLGCNFIMFLFFVLNNSSRRTWSSSRRTWPSSRRTHSSASNQFIVRRNEHGVHRDEHVAYVNMILLLRPDEHDLHRDEGVVRHDEATWFSTTTSLLLIFLPFLHRFAIFSLTIHKTHSNEGLDHSLVIMV